VSIGVSFFFNDYITPQRIRSTSLNEVFRRDQWAKTREMAPGIALSYFKGLSPNIDFAGTAAFSFPRIPIENKPDVTSAPLLSEVDASFNFKMLPDNFFFSPYLIAGVGASKYGSSFGAFVPLGGGVKFNFFEEASLFITHQYRIPVISGTNNYHFMSSIGIAGSVGKKSEPELKPLPPAPPKDTDGDGINDEQDRCPTVAGIAKYQGCPIPDTDNDGVNDEEDKCPTVPGLAKYAGCPIPDTDGDGINDEEDKCPTVAGIAKYQGCPIPDTDNDGVNDEEDKCPTLPGTAANNGCPEVKQEVVNRVNYAARNIFFITGSAKLSSKSNKALDEIVKILSEDQNLKLSVEGHTDNVGKSAFNQTLSENRANSVKEYLVRKGVDENRLNAQGFGMDRPVADNKTAAGRSKNRRVELKLGYE
jgi:outer membrane protein OmpA-like peptidoglycan-associated protein